MVKKYRFLVDWTHGSATKAKHVREEDRTPCSCSQLLLLNPALAAFLSCPLFITGRLAMRQPADTHTAGNIRVCWITPSLTADPRSYMNLALEEMVQLLPSLDVTGPQRRRDRFAAKFSGDFIGMRPSGLQKLIHLLPDKNNTSKRGPRTYMHGIGNQASDAFGTRRVCAKANAV